MRRPSGALIAAMLLLATTPTTHASEETPRLRINYLAYPVNWNGKTIMIGARFQAPLNTTGKIPGVILLHGSKAMARAPQCHGRSTGRVTEAQRRSAAELRLLIGATPSESSRR